MKFLLPILTYFFAFTLHAETAVYFTPSNACENNIVKLLNNAKQQIDIAVYSITNKNIADAINNAHRRGIKIRILTDKTQASNKSAKALELYNAGINIKVHSKHRIEHNKFVVVDGESVMTGSYNWTSSATLKNSENCLKIWNDEQTISDYQKRFEYLWEVNSKEKSDMWFELKALENMAKKVKK
ncbi:MAG: phospholipase D family protein [Alphaproteobacteria bacterium]|nr:phospholipase D family protein [Alphaproteobacteria bacterium]